MSEYTPTTEEVRQSYGGGDVVPGALADAEFDRWLAAHDEKVLEAVEGHSVDFYSSRNLGYYRTEVDCKCGAKLWFGEHDGDPQWNEVWRAHRLAAIRAEATS